MISTIFTHSNYRYVLRVCIITTHDNLDIPEFKEYLLSRLLFSGGVAVFNAAVMQPISLGRMVTFLQRLVTLDIFPVFIGYLVMCLAANYWRRRTSPLDLRQVSQALYIFTFFMRDISNIMVKLPARLDSFFTSYGLPWSTMSGSGSTLHLIVGIVFVFSKDYAGKLIVAD